MGGPDMAPQTPQTFGAPGMNPGAPLSPSPHTLGAPRRSRGTRRYFERLLARRALPLQLVCQRGHDAGVLRLEALEDGAGGRQRIGATQRLQLLAVRRQLQRSDVRAARLEAVRGRASCRERV